MMKDIHSLDVAFNPDSAIEDSIGIQAPTSQEIWDQVKSSPGAAWEQASGLVDGLPDFSVSDTYNRIVATGAALVEWVMGSGGDASDGQP